MYAAVAMPEHQSAAPASRAHDAVPDTAEPGDAMNSSSATSSCCSDWLVTGFDGRPLSHSIEHRNQNDDHQQYCIDAMPLWLDVYLSGII